MVHSFTDLTLTPAMLAAIDRAGYSTPTPIQAQAIGPIFDGRDLIGCAQTGTGKTAAFAIPMIELLTGTGQRLAGNPARLGRSGPSAPVLARTRELALQIAKAVATLVAAP